MNRPVRNRNFTWAMASTGALIIVGCLVWQYGFAQSGAVALRDTGTASSDELTLEGSYRKKKEQLKALDSVRLDELRRRKIKFDELSDKDRAHVQSLHSDLNAHPQGEALRGVMHRYYKWLKTLDEKTRRELLDLPPEERLARIRELREAQAKEAFGRVGASKLPAEDVKWVYEWIKKVVQANRRQIDVLVATEDFQKRLPTSIQTIFTKPARNIQRSNYRFQLLARYAPELAREIAYREFSDLRDGLSKSALEIIDAYEVEEQKDLIVQWFLAIDYARRNPTDENLYQFWLSLTEEEHEKLETMSSEEWRSSLVDWCIRNLRAKEQKAERSKSSSSLKGRAPVRRRRQ